jgi:hypothetical protein
MKAGGSVILLLPLFQSIIKIKYIYTNVFQDIQSLSIATVSNLNTLIVRPKQLWLSWFLFHIHFTLENDSHRNVKVKTSPLFMAIGML